MPAGSPGTVVAVCVERRSLADRQSVRNWFRARMDHVPVASGPIPAPVSTPLSSTRSIRSPPNSGQRTGSPKAVRPSAASTSVMVVPPAPKSHTAITPRAGRPDSLRSAVSAAA